MSPGQYVVIHIASVLWFIIMVVALPLWIIPVVLIAAAVSRGNIKHFWWCFKVSLLSFKSIFNMPVYVTQTALFTSYLKGWRWDNMRK